MSLLSKKDLITKLFKSKKFRDAYVYEHVRNGIPFQSRALREQRDWTQADLGEAANKPRNVITRLENPNYGKLTLKTLFEIASGCNVALLIKFVPFSRLLKEYEDVSSEALYAAGITDEEEIRKLEEWAADEPVEDDEAVPDSKGLVAALTPLPQQPASLVPSNIFAAKREQRKGDTAYETLVSSTG